MALGLIFAVVLRSGLRSTGKRGFPVYFKILVSHLQVLGLVSSFDLQWPREVALLLNSSQRVASSPQAIFSFDCFLQSSLGAPFKRFYIYLVIYWTLPLIAIILSSICCLRKSWRPKAFPTILICFYLLQPWVARSLLDAFDCL